LASLYADRLGTPHLSTGEIFRQEIARESPLGKRVKGYVTKGKLVPDGLVVEVMAGRVKQAGKEGFILDGFPRTSGQAEGLDRVLREARQSLTAAVYLTSPRELLVRRLSGRLVCSKCGENYHVRTMRPKRAGLCDRCGARLTTRKDDEPRTIRKRLALDHKNASPLLAYYKAQGLLHPVNGVGNVERVYDRTLKLFRRQGWLNDRAQKPRRA
jgi:adenylate kinase